MAEKEKDTQGMSTKAEREAECEHLLTRYNDPEDPYDAHHGTDRSEESLEWAKDHDPDTYERVTRKIAEGR